MARDIKITFTTSILLLKRKTFSDTYALRKSAGTLELLLLLGLQFVTAVMTFFINRAKLANVSTKLVNVSTKLAKNRGFYLKIT